MRKSLYLCGMIVFISIGCIKKSYREITCIQITLGKITKLQDHNTCFESMFLQDYYDQDIVLDLPYCNVLFSGFTYIINN